MEKVMNKEENELGLDVYINSHIDISKIPDILLISLLAGIETNMANYYQRKEKRKKNKKKTI